MPKNLRIRTEIGVDKEVTLDLSQDFDMLEILSLKLHQTKTGRFIKGVSIRGKTVEELEESIKIEALSKISHNSS